MDGPTSGRCVTFNCPTLAIRVHPGTSAPCLSLAQCEHRTRGLRQLVRPATRVRRMAGRLVVQTSLSSRGLVARAHIFRSRWDESLSGLGGPVPSVALSAASSSPRLLP